MEKKGKKEYLEDKIYIVEVMHLWKYKEKRRGEKKVRSTVRGEKSEALCIDVMLHRGASTRVLGENDEIEET